MFVECEVIYELSYQKESTSRRAFEAIGSSGIGYAFRIKSLALILHMHLDPTSELAKGYVHSLPRIEPVTVHDGVGQGLGKRDTEIEANRPEGQPAGQAMPRHNIDGMLDDIQFTRDRDGHQDRSIGSK